MVKRTPVEAGALLAWHLAHGDACTVDNAACLIERITPEAFYDLDAPIKYRLRKRAKQLLCRISRVLPIYDKREGSETVWEAVVFGELEGFEEGESV